MTLTSNRGPVDSVRGPVQRRWRSRSCACRGHTSCHLNITVRLKPANSATQRVFHRNDQVSQLAPGLGGGGKHFLSAHPHRIDGGPRLFLQNDSSKELVQRGKPQRHRVRHLGARRRQSRKRRELIQNLFQCEIFAAQDVALSRSCFLHGQ